MKKTAEQEVRLKLAIRNIIVRNPLISGHQLCRDLASCPDFIRSPPPRRIRFHRKAAAAR
jgi:hypothetical protein